MGKNKLQIIMFGFLLLFAADLKAQLPAQFGQYMFNGLVLNPAYAGSREVLSLSFAHRNQWMGFPGSPHTETLSLHAPSKDLKNNFGILFMHDKIGVSKRNLLMASYAYRIPLKYGKLSFGLQAGAHFMQINYAEVYTHHVGDPSFENNSPVYSIPKFGFGTYYTHDYFYVGFSIPELLSIEGKGFQSINPEEIQYRHYFLTAGALLRFSKDVKVKPSVLMKYMKSVPTQFDLNVNVILKDKVWIGASYRTQEALMGLLEFQLNQQVRIGYSFGHGFNKLSKFHYGTHEVMISYEFGYTIKTRDPVYF